MNKDWRKTIFERTCLKNIYNKTRSRGNLNSYKKQRKLFTNLRKKSMKRHFRNVSEGKLFSSNMNFGKFIKPFLANKRFIANRRISISLKEGSEIITFDKGLSETFNNHYIGMIEKTAGSKPDVNLHKFCDIDIHSAISKIKDTNVNHPSIIEIKKVTKNETAFYLKEVEEKEFVKLLKSIDSKKSTGKISYPFSLLTVLLTIYTNL